jgi:hypothetical protein
MKIQNSPHADNFPYSHDIRSRLRGDLIYDWYSRFQPHRCDDDNAC